MEKFDRIWAGIDLDAIRYNIKSIASVLEDDVKILAVLKANAYGHGAQIIANELENYDEVYGLAVATAEEAVSLRENGVKKPIIIMGYTFHDSYTLLCEKDIQPTVYLKDMVEELSVVATLMKTTIKVQIKVDTGMSRIGISPDESGCEFVRFVKNLPGIEIEGIFTHFANADMRDRSSAKEQFDCFTKFITSLENEGIHFPMKHCANSAAIIEMKNTNLDMVRAGIILYGLWPSSDVAKDKISLKPVLSLKSRVIHIKELGEGQAISYGGRFVTKGKTKVATISAGYGDGYPRALSEKGYYVLIHGKRAPILGRICMDQFMVDVTDIENVKVGDVVTLLGTDGNEKITLEEIADVSDTFNYELACNINMRVPRIFSKDGKVIKVTDYIREMKQ